VRPARPGPSPLADARAGGVTSSSLEVLAGLALSTDEYIDLMVFKDGQPSAFYQSYVRDIQAKISENAAAEFACIWREHARTAGAKPRTLVSDELSTTLNALQAELEGSDLFDDAPSRRGVLRRAIPKTLVDQIGLDTLLQRLPEPYQRALFSSWVASHFVRAPSSYFLEMSLMSTHRSTSTAWPVRASTSSTSRVTLQTDPFALRTKWTKDVHCNRYLVIIFQS
jgi:NAD-specific glutamate dehydrogenase